MCRMLIAVGNVNPSSLIDGAISMAKDINSVHELNEKQGQGSWKHGDGWGAAYLDENGEWVIKRSTKAIYEDPEIDKLRNIKTNLLMIHTRYKMGSETSIHNTHPFRFDKAQRSKASSASEGQLLAEKGESFIFCHNGFIEEDIYYDKKFEAKGDTDSERLFYSILTDLRKSNTIKAIRKNFKRYKKLKGTNIILSTKSQTIVAMRENQFPRYYQMSIGRTKDMTVVSSEQFNITGIFWEPLRQGDIVKIYHDKLRTKIIKERKNLKQKIYGLYNLLNKSVKKDETNLVTYHNS